MSFPFRLNTRPETFQRLVEHLRSVVERFPDERTGETTYSMADAALGAFSVFFTQSPSFLDFQRSLQATKGCNNALSLFGVTRIPSDNQIRNLLDAVPPSAVLSVFDTVVEALHGAGQSPGCCPWSRNSSSPRMGTRNRTARTPRPNVGSSNSVRVTAPWA